MQGLTSMIDDEADRPTCLRQGVATLRFTLANLKLFRILCANHHYELTLTGKIVGTDIVQ
jgi:hypothetical protein